MQFAGLDGSMAELIPPCTDPAHLDASQDRRFRHADSFRRLPEGVTHAAAEHRFLLLIQSGDRPERLMESPVPSLNCDSNLTDQAHENQ